MLEFHPLQELVRAIDCVPTDNASRGPERLLSATASPPGMSARTATLARVGGGSVPPQPAGDIAQECSTAPVVVPVARVSPGDLLNFPWSLQHRLADAISRGSAKSTWEPKCREQHYASTSELSDALSVRGDKSNAMRCRKKQRDALSVRNCETLRYISILPGNRRSERRS